LPRAFSGFCSCSPWLPPPFDGWPTEGQAPP
jgi:hypothetical protein